MSTHLRAAVVISVIATLVAPVTAIASTGHDLNVGPRRAQSHGRLPRGDDVGAGRQILIYGPSLAERRRVNEATIAQRLGFGVEVATRPEWMAMTKDEFGAFDAIVFGDPYCKNGTKRLTSAVKTQDVWSPTVLGSVAISGADPVWHARNLRRTKGPRRLIANMILATALGTETGLSVSLSCYYAGARAGTPVDLLGGFGTFTVLGQGRGTLPNCPNHIEIVEYYSPLVTGITARHLSRWDCSVHQAIDEHPDDFTPVAIERRSGLPVLLLREEA